MPLHIVRAAGAEVLWETCADRFLETLGHHPGPEGYPAFLWLTHRNHRDLLLERAAARGFGGWLHPPYAFLSQLPDLFQLPGRPVGLLTRRRLLTRVAASAARAHGIGVTQRDSGVVRGHMLDALFAELLPEGVAPEELERGLAALPAARTDDFVRRRNDWIVEVYRGYLRELSRRGEWDFRSSNAALAEAVRAGRLREVLGGARELHVYGALSLRSRHRLMRALADQQEVRVSVYLPLEDEGGDEWESLPATHEVVNVRGPLAPHGSAPGIQRVPTVQPAPDAHRELRWVAGRVKALLRDGVEPHELAVVARTGEDDTRRAFQALRDGGVPATARIRTRLSEIAALKALLELFRGTARGWSYRPLRNVLASPYFGARVDLRSIDRLARSSRIESLDDWIVRLERLLDARRTHDRETRRFPVHPKRLESDIDTVRRFRDVVAPLAGERSETEWVALTRRVLAEGWLDLRRRLCRPVGQRWDVVRLDQRGVRQVELLLAEWARLDLDPEPMGAEQWYRLLVRLLESNELVLSTPASKGVQVLEAHDAALTPFRHVFVVHANDGVFPRVTQPAGLLAEEEWTALRAAGLPVSDRDTALRRERSLWRACVQGGEVTVTYRTTDPAGTPLLPSLMVPAHDPAAELPRTAEPEDAPIGPGEADRAAVVALARTFRAGAGGVGGEAAPAGRPAGSAAISVPDTMAARHAVLGALAEQLRGSRPGGPEVPAPGPWNGHLRDPVVLERLEATFGPEYRWSPSQLEMYATCPFYFLLNRVLWLEDAAEAEEEPTPLDFGSVAHDLLHRFYAELGERRVLSFDERAAAVLEAVEREVLARHEAEGRWLGSPVLWQQKRRQIVDAVRDYLAWELPKAAQAGEWPVWYEYLLEHDDGRPLELAGEDLAGRPRALRIRGRIDRVDRAHDGGGVVHHVLDYKSGSVPFRGYRDGSLLQAPLYMEALRRKEGVVVGRGRYRVISKPGTWEGAKVAYDDDDYRRALAIAFSIPGRIRAGLFEAVLAGCQRNWPSWYPDRAVRRTDATWEEGTRFDG